MTRGRRAGLLTAGVVIGVVGGYLFYTRHRSTGLAVAPPPRVGSVAPREQASVELPTVRFTDVTAASGVQFKHFNGATGRKLLPETMGSGVAFLDYDADGDQDLLLVNGCAWPDDAASPSATAALFSNDGSGQFTDVSAETGMNVSFYGMGATAGDYDNDGFPDVYLTGVGRNMLLHNESGKRFRDVTDESGASGGGGWSTGATFLDYDNDGKLDLWVCHYIQWSPEIDLAQGFQIAGVGRAYGPPKNFAGAYCTLYRGDGSGHFEDVSERAGIRINNRDTGVPLGKSLAAITCDFDGDGWTDVLVANDTVRNFLFRNKGDGTFDECGETCGVAYDEMGNARGAMGVDAADFRNDGLIGVAIGNFANEMNALYVQMDESHRMAFTDAALAEGIGGPSRRLLKFGLFFFDFDLDGRLDLLSANGHLDADIEKVQASQRFAQPAQLFWNCGPGSDVTFVELTSRQAGEDLFKPIVGRGSAYADIDGDGDLDVLLTSNGGAPLLLRNDVTGRNWIRLSLEGTSCNRSALGARVELRTKEGLQRREVRAARSYLSQSELPITFGLGGDDAIGTLSVRWPGGAEEHFDGLAINQTHAIRQGQGSQFVAEAPR